MFMGSSLFMAMDIADIILRFKITFLDNSSFEVIQDRMNQADVRTQSLAWTGEILFVFMVRWSLLLHANNVKRGGCCLKLILGDSVVLWRTWAIYCGKRIFVIIPFLTWFGSLGALVSFELL